MAPFEMCAPESRLPVCAGMNALAGQRLDVETVDHIDLLLQRLQRLERLAELHRRAGAFGAPMIFVDAVSQENHAEPFGERGRRRAYRRTRAAIQATASAMVQPAPRSTVRREMRRRSS